MGGDILSESREEPESARSNQGVMPDLVAIQVMVFC